MAVLHESPYQGRLLVFIVVSGNMILSSMDENKQLEQQLAYWNDIPDYYHLRFSNITTKLPDNSRNFTREERKKEAKRINQDMLPLLERAEQSGGILLRDNDLAIRVTFLPTFKMMLIG